jgi:hypothetical protein
MVSRPPPQTYIQKAEAGSCALSRVLVVAGSPITDALEATARRRPRDRLVTARDPAEPVPPDALRELMKIIEGACRKNVLPLLSKLPRDKADPDTERKAKIEAMG